MGVFMGLLEELRELGVNTDEGVQRLMGNASLYERMLGTFTKLMNETSIEIEEFDRDDCTELIEKTHALKGASGNLSVTPVYDAYTEIVNLLRRGYPGEAKALFEKVLPIQTEIVQCIERHK